jgi:ribosomal protein S18 acetylase RimI-like enzyme
MERSPERALRPATRWSEAGDAEALTTLYRDTWRYAYAGVIPGPGLERMLARRGSGWWRRLHDAGARVLVIEFGDELAGYALIGRCRGGPGGEIQELYVRPEFTGLGFGRKLFEAARAEFRARAIAPLTIWCLAANTLGCGFYRSMGGRETGRSRERIGGADLEKLRFSWD